MTLSLEPPTKRTRAGTKAKARAALAQAFERSVLVRHARTKTTWPKPRASIALDIHLFSGNPGGARVDSMCKWLLDELAGLVYEDDRQVKLLFARVSRPQPLPPRGADVDDLWARVHTETTQGARRPRSSNLHITAQTRSNVFDDLRAVSDLDERWNPFDEEQGRLYRTDPVRASFRRDDLVDHHAMLDSDSDHDVLWRRMLSHQIDYHDQAQEQYSVDLAFSSLFTDLPVDRFGIWNRVRGRISFTPYIFDIGVLPGHGESNAFRERFRALLEERRERWPGLFPMRARSGISMVLFENPASGKDLDNLIRTVLPDVLEVLRPQQQDLQGWVADEADPADGIPDVPFIEVAAFPAHLADMPPGSVVFGLSTADRFDSWWHLAADHLERALEREEEDGSW